MTPPKIVTATEPTELIVTDGEPRWLPNNGLPEAFAGIPADSPKAGVRVHVAGTVEAREEALDNVVPEVAAVKRESTSIDVKYDGAPKFEIVKDVTTVSYAVNTAASVFKVGSWAFRGATDHSGSPSAGARVRTIDRPIPPVDGGDPVVTGRRITRTLHRDQRCTRACVRRSPRRGRLCRHNSRPGPASTIVQAYRIAWRPEPVRGTAHVRPRATPGVAPRPGLERDMRARQRGTARSGAAAGRGGGR